MVATPHGLLPRAGMQRDRKKKRPYTESKAGRGAREKRTREKRSTIMERRIEEGNTSVRGVLGC